VIPPISNREIPRAEPIVTRSKKRRTINASVSIHRQFATNSRTIRCPCDLYHSKADRSSGTDDLPVFRRLSPLSGRGYPTQGREGA
jgi:hypothetical protein